MAYDPRMAAALSGATIAQLQYWRSGDHPVLVPEVSAERPILYSFRDLVALRTFVYLRAELSLQRIRRALRTLKSIGKTEHLSKYRLLAQSKRSIVLVEDTGEGAIELVERPGQYVAVVKLGDVMRSFPLDDIEVPDLAHPRKEIAVEPEIRRGYPTVRGTRIAYDLVAELVRDGVPPEEIKHYYAGVSAAAARDAASFASYVDRAGRRQAA